MKRLNVTRLLDDLGGPQTAAESIGKGRTALYRARRDGHMDTHTLEYLMDCGRLLVANSVLPSFNIADYFEDTPHK